jgi:hypothetical protein
VASKHGLILYVMVQSCVAASRLVVILTRLAWACAQG